MDVHRAVFEVDVFPAQRAKLAGSREEIDGQRDHAAPFKRHVLARDEGEELARVKELLSRALAAVRTGRRGPGRTLRP